MYIGEKSVMDRSMVDNSLDRAIGARLQSLRDARGLSLGELATRSGVSKAMIARVEKAESSATASLLGRLCAGLGVTLSSVVAAGERPAERVSRRAAQSVWQDPASGYLRRHVSPPGAASGIEIIAVDLPPGAHVPYAAWEANPYTQQLYMLSGALSLKIGEDAFELLDGDCIDFDVGRPVQFANRGAEAARYLVIIRKP
jgi:transcriptional regulator with XRE-family HTH domain